MSYQPPSQPGGDAPPPDGEQGGSSSGGDYSSGQGNYTQPIGGSGSGDMGGSSSSGSGDMGGSSSSGSGSDMSGSGSGGYTPPPSGGYTPPPSGGYNPPPPSGDYVPPSSGGGDYTGSSSGGYTPPPGGGYTPPPSGGYNPPPSGGYNPPPGGGFSPPPSGGYNPPPGGGYNPPPGGGYNPPPPPPPPPGGMGGTNMNMSSLNRNVAIGNSSFNPGELIQSYINAVTKPNPQTYEAEMGNASWVKVLVGIAAVAVIGFIFSLISSAIGSAVYSSIFNQFNSGGQFGNAFSTSRYFTGGSPLYSLIGPFITFFIGTGLQYLFAKMLGGQGNDFMVQSYLSSLSYTPLRIIAAVLSVVPGLNLCIAFLAALYQIYSVGLSLQASQRLQSGRAQLAAWLTFILFLVLLCVCLVAFAGLLASLAGSTNNP